VMANELLDNLAFGIAERVDGGWAPVRVGLHNSELAMFVAERDSALDYLTELAPEASFGQRVPVAVEAAAWIAEAQALCARVLVFDYAATTAELADRGQSGWLRTYAAHTRGNDPLDQVGYHDITHDVPTDQLPTPNLQQTQAEWLASNGMPGRVDAARQVWTERAHIGDLAAIVARSAIGEAEALSDPNGLGAFLVLEWHAEPDTNQA
jgi:SAM-dependent MidA family methyltransferase